VKAGQLLAEIESPEVDQQLQQAQASLGAAQANLHLAQTTAERYQGLLKTESVAKQDADNAMGNFEARQADVQAAQANVNRLQEMKSFERIEAPFDGVITARNVEVGTLIDAGSGAPARELFHISDTRRLRVHVSVPQGYSAVAKPGLKADLTLPELPGRRFAGTLVRTANAIDPASRTLLAEFEVPNPAGELLPGSYAELHFKLPEEHPVWQVPINALLFRAEGLRVVAVDKNNRTVLIPVTLGRDTGKSVEVLTGLNGDESLIVDPSDSILGGQEVRVVQAPKSGGRAS
jgi:RND family efflux transporter MFP subunit